MNTRILKTLAASVLASTAALASASTASASSSLIKGASFVNTSADWGNSDFNSSYHAWAGLYTKQDIINLAPPGMGSVLDMMYPANYVYTGGTASTQVTMFGHSMTIVAASALATRSNSTITSSYDFELAGMTISSGSLTKYTFPSIPIVFFEAESEFDVGPVPITVDASANGELGLTAAATLATSGLSITVTPSAKAYIDASAGVGFPGASAGITGSLTAIELAVPVKTGVTFTAPMTLTFNANAKLTLSSLDGSLGLYADVPLYGHHEWDFVTWSGHQWPTTTLYDASGTLNL